MGHALASGTVFPILLLWVLLAAACPAPALVVLGDEAAHTKAPPPREGFPVFSHWDHVVALGAYSGVYLGGRWVLTAGHVGMREATIRGRRYPPERRSEIDLRTAFYPADLILFQVQGDPGLSTLPLTRVRPDYGDEGLLLGWGRGGGAALDWKGRGGRAWREGPAMLRWGRNRVHRVGVHSSLKGFVTETFGMRFDLERGVWAEAQASQGDSGGAVFFRDGGGWALGGVLLMIKRHPGQPPYSALAGNETFAADLAYYREQIEAITGLRRPELP